jgi:hypothetical protein
MLGTHCRREGRGGEEKGLSTGYLATRVTAIPTPILAFVHTCHSFTPFLHHAIDDPRISRQTSRRRVCCRCERIGIKVECAVCVLRLAAPRVKKTVGGEARQCLSRRRKHAKKQVPNLVTYHLELPFQRHFICIFPLHFSLFTLIKPALTCFLTPIQPNPVSHPQINV